MLRKNLTSLGTQAQALHGAWANCSESVDVCLRIKKSRNQSPTQALAYRYRGGSTDFKHGLFKRTKFQTKLTYMT